MTQKKGLTRTTSDLDGTARKDNESEKKPLQIYFGRLVGHPIDLVKMYAKRLCVALDRGGQCERSHPKVQREEAGILWQHQHGS